MAAKIPFSLRLSEEEKSELKRKADANNMSAGDYIRSILFDDKNEPVSSNTQEKHKYLTKYEWDLIGYEANNAILLRHIIDILGKQNLITEAKELADKWRSKNYKLMETE